MKTINYILSLLALLGVGSYTHSQCNNAPIINNFSPNTGFIGSTVTISGANFDANNIANNVVYFGATKAQVVQASFGQLKVIVPVGASTDRISVTNQCYLTAYSKVPFNGIFCPTPLDGSTYQNNAQVLSVNYGAYNMIAVDLDLDGRAEVLSSGTGTGVSIAVNNCTPGNMNFGLIEFNQSSGTIYAADLDGDGRKDIIGRYNSYLNTSTPGSISFGANASNQNVSSYQIAAGDFNNDGKIDLVGEYGNSIFIARNLSTGPGNINFESRQLVQAGVGRATGIQTADVDGDGKIDILISQGNYNRAMTFRNITPNGSNTFTFEPGEIWSTGGTYPYRCQIADFNKDGKIDFTTCNYVGTNNTAVLINMSTPGNIDMSGLVNLPSFNNNYRIQVGDVDGDGYPDIVTKSLGVNQFAVYKNTTTSPTNVSFANPIYYSSSAQAEVSGIVIGDLDGDYVPDIATSGISSRQIRFHRNTSAQVDVDPPTAICKDIVLPLGPDGTAQLTPSMIDNGSSDACGVDNISISPSSFTCADIGPNSVMLVVTDGAGNSDTCFSTVNVQPAAIIAAGQTTVCQGETVTLNANDGDSFQWKLNGSSISGATQQQYLATVSGDYTVVVTNALGCSGESLPTTVVVNDNPTVDVSPAGTVYLCNASRDLVATESAIYQWKLNGVDISNANQQVLTVSAPGYYSIEVIDLFGCTAISDSVQVLNGSPEIALSYAQNGNPVANGDNSPSAAEGTDYGQVLPGPPHTRDFVISNNGNVDLTIEDIFLSGPDANTSFQFATVNLPMVIPPGQSDTVQIIFQDNAIRTYAATAHLLNNDCDDGDYSYDLAAEITCDPAHFSSTPGLLTSPANNSCEAVVSYTVSAQGNPTPALSYVMSGATSSSGNGEGSGTTFGLGTTSVTVTATNACGTDQVVFEVVVEDQTPPQLAAQDVTVYLDGSGQAQLTAQQVDAGTTDNCGLSSLVITQTQFLCQHLGDNSIYLTATDVNGNMDSVLVTVTVVDDIDPSIVCPADISTSNDSGDCGALVNFAAIASDNCVANVSYSHAPNSYFDVGTTTVTATATDVSGNTATCSFDVTVMDDENPVVQTQNITITLSNGMAGINPQDIDNGTTDNCGVADLAIDVNFFDCDDIGTHTVALTATDVHGNSSTSTAQVLVMGIVPSCNLISQPTSAIYTGGDPTRLYLGYGAQSTVLQPNASGGSSFTYQWSGTDLNCYNCAAPTFTPTQEGSYTFVVDITNEYGCTVSCTITICVFDVRDYGKNGKGAPKIEVCHIPPGNPGNAHTVLVNANSVATHLAHGCSLGACGTTNCSQLPGRGMQSTEYFVDNDWKDEHNFEAMLYPNPSSDWFMVDFVGIGEETIQFDLMDIHGKVIWTEQIEARYSHQFNPEVVPGSYTLVIRQGDHWIRKSILKL